MAQFLLEIAGHTGAVTSLFDSTPHYFAPYLGSKEPEFSVTVSPEDLTFEQDDARREAEEEGFRPRVFTDPFLDRAAIQRQFAEFLFDRDILLVHGSTVALDGKAYLFTARSGTGKSTHTRLWRQVFGHRAVMVNDDKPFLEIGRDSVTAHGSPWSGKHGLDCNISVPLQGICLLERGAENVISPAKPEELLPWLRHETYLPRDPEKAPRHRALVEALANTVPLWRMKCTKEPEAAEIAHRAMSK